MVAKVVMTLSVRLYWRTAARIPTGIDTTIVTMSAAPIRSIVAGTRSITFFRTGCPSV